jgi:hypothetical protein
VVGKSVFRTGLVLILVLVAAGMFAVVGRADDPRFGDITSSMAPGIVDANSNVLVKASWHYIDTRTLNHSSVRFIVPAGWTLEDADPDVCDQPTGSNVVTCPRGTIRPGDTIAQAVELKTDGDLGGATVEADLLFSEGPENPGRTQVQPADDVHTTVIAAGSGEPDKVGKCVDSNQSVSTDAGSGNSETTATVPETDELCTPISIDERIRLTAQESCIDNYACVLDIVTTDSVLFPATDPIKLKITYRGQSINNLPLIFISGALETFVPECPDDNVAAPDPCYSDKRTRQQSVTWFVNWTGLDPGWTG